MRYTLILALLFAPLPAFAGTASPKDSFETMAQAVRAGDAQAEKTLLTARSQDLYSRFVSYNLFSCLPKDAQYVSETEQGDVATVQSSLTDLAGKKRVAKLAFMREGGIWKLDLPESLRRGMGEKWQQQVNTTEQIYLMLKMQLGDRLQCSMLKDIVATQ